MSIAQSVHRVATALLAASLFAVLLAFVAVPGASAHHEVGFDGQAPVGTPCPAGTTPGGSTFGAGGVERVRCIFAPSSRLTTEVQCTAAGGLWLGTVSPPICSAPGFVVPVLFFDAGMCPVGLQYYANGNVCAVPLRTRHAGNIYKPVCIEDSMLQDDPAFANLRVNGEIQADASTAYFVQSGAGCTFGCADGFDANCDGKFGDYCRVEIDRNVVSGAGTCIAEMNAAPKRLAHVGPATGLQ